MEDSDSGPLSNKKAMVIGASGGMGRAVAIALAKRGVNLALVGRRQAALIEVADICTENGVDCFPVVCDISRTGELESTVKTAVKQLDGLNFLINCAGISVEGKLHEADMGYSDSIINTNLRAHMYLARYALPEINLNPGGAVLKIGAVNHPYSGANSYLAANLGGDGLAAAMFEDVREFGTRVCTIKPGWVNTPLVKGKNIDPALMIQADDIAQTVVFMLTMPGTACPTEITILPQRSPYI